MDGYDTQKVQYPEESKLTIVHPEESKLTIVRRSYEGKLLAQKRGNRETVLSVTSYCGLLSTCGESVPAFLADPRSLADR